MGLTDPVGELWDLLVWIYNNIISAIQSAINIIFDGLNQVVSILSDYIWGLLNDVVKIFVSWIDAAWDSIILWITDTGNWIVRQLETVAGWISGWIVDANNFVVRQLETVAGWIGGWVVDAANFVVRQLETVYGWIANRIVEGTNWIVRQLDTVAGWIAGWIVDGTNWIVRQLQTVYDWIIDDLEYVSNAILSAIGAVWSIIKGVGDAIANLAVTLTDFISTLMSVFTDILGVIWQGILTAIQEIAGFFASLSELSVDDVLSVLTAVNEKMLATAKRMPAP